MNQTSKEISKVAFGSSLVERPDSGVTVMNGFQMKVACMLVDRTCIRITINPCIKRLNLNYISLVVKPKAN